MSPAAEDIAPRQPGGPVHVDILRRRKDTVHKRCSFLPRINVALDGEGVASGKVRVRPETAMNQIHAIVSVLSVQVGEMILIEIVRKEPVCSASLGCTAVLHRAKSL